MKCPSCATGVHVEFEEESVTKAPDYVETMRAFQPESGVCPECGQLIIVVSIGKFDHTDGYASLKEPIERRVVFPQSASRPLDPEIPSSFRGDFSEAVAVLPFSPRASAALSRRVLQHLLQDHFGIKKRTLDQQIDEFLKLPNLPSYLADAVDAIRHVGNLAAHPAKYQTTGEIVAVEPGEADWLLDVLESLFDFAFVQPARLEAKRQALDTKLSAAGKPNLRRAKA